MAKAFVVGNAALDELISVTRLPCAGESILGAARNFGLGGKGANQAVALGRTGIDTTFVFAVARDWTGETIQKALTAEPLTLAPLVIDQGASDRSVILQEPSGDNQIVTTNAAAEALTLEVCRAPLRRAAPGDALLLQGNLTIETTADLIAHAKSRGLRVMFNPSPYQPGFVDLLTDISALFVNAVEARLLTGQDGSAALDALRQTGAHQVVLTQGAHGVWLAGPDGAVHIPAIDCPVCDVTGAGDCFEGVAIGSSLRRNGDIDALAIHHGVKAASLAIAQPGAVASYPTQDDMASICVSNFAASPVASPISGPVASPVSGPVSTCPNHD